MPFLHSLIPTVVVLGALIIIHEFGHYLACLMSRVKVEKFSIGFGPEIFKWNRGGTSYVVSLLPLGGFVKPAGESFGDLDEQGPKPGDYLAAPVFSRIFIVTAGVIMNYILAYVLFVAIFMMGRPVPGTTVGGFVKDYPAESSGLQKGDKITEVGGFAVSTWAEMTDALNKAESTPISLKVVRESVVLDFSVSPKIDEVTDPFGKRFEIKRLGITPHPEATIFEKYSFGQSIKAAGDTVWFLATSTYKAIGYLAIGKLSLKSMSGPLGIMNMAGDAAKLGLPYLLQLTATLSISLAVINLLPIPALDGGHLLFLLIELIRRKRVSLAFQEKATQVGFALLLALMAFIIYNDLVNLNVFDKVKSLFGQ